MLRRNLRMWRHVLFVFDMNFVVILGQFCTDYAFRGVCVVRSLRCWLGTHVLSLAVFGSFGSIWLVRSVRELYGDAREVTLFSSVSTVLNHSRGLACGGVEQVESRLVDHLPLGINFPVFRVRVICFLGLWYVAKFVLPDSLVGFEVVLQICACSIAQLFRVEFNDQGFRV
jgi:hypothetical protein